MAMLLARTSMRRVPSKTVGVQRRFLNNDFTMHDTSNVIKNTTRLGGSSGRISKFTPIGAWYDPAIVPLYISIGAGCVMCAYVCALKLTTYPDIVWYKRKPVDNVVFNEGNTAASYNEQRLFLHSGSERSTRLLGGSTFGGTNQIWAHKRGNKDAQMHF